MYSLKELESHLLIEIGAIGSSSTKLSNTYSSSSSSYSSSSSFFFLFSSYTFLFLLSFLLYDTGIFIFIFYLINN
jgi:hypothetical protein